MWKKLLILSLSIAVLFVFSAPITPVDAGGKWGKRKVNWRIAGTIAQLIDVTNPLSRESEGLHSLINLTAYGPPGPAKITLLSKTSWPPEEASAECAEGYNFGQLTFTKNDMVAMFPDQSLLFASIHEDLGILCFGPTGTYFWVRMYVKGGTDRFEGASGVIEASGNGYFIEPGIPPAGSDNTLVGENGKMTGTIEFSD